MSTHRRFIVTLVGIITTCVMSAGAASAKPAPSEPDASGMAAPGLVAAQHASGNASGAKDGAERLLKQQSYIQRVERIYAAKAAAAARSRAVQQHAGILHGRSLVAPDSSTANQGSTSNAASQHSGDGSEVAVLAVTALAGLALGAAGSTASRRLRNRPGMAA